MLRATRRCGTWRGARCSVGYGVRCGGSRSLGSGRTDGTGPGIVTKQSPRFRRRDGPCSRAGRGRSACGGCVWVPQTADFFAHRPVGGAGFARSSRRSRVIEARWSSRRDASKVAHVSSRVGLLQRRCQRRDAESSRGRTAVVSQAWAHKRLPSLAADRADPAMRRLLCPAVCWLQAPRLPSCPTCSP